MPKSKKNSKTNENFTPVNTREDFVAMEEKIQSYWQENDILDKYLKRNEDSEKRFSFIDGPITANGLMGLHHAWGRSYKDLVQRYKNMKGYKQRFQNGFDCQGLWVEVEVEKQLDFNSKKDIEDYGLDNFTLACKGRVNKYSKLQTEDSERLGMFMDWENSYYTMSEENNLAIWAFLKKAYEEGLLYKGQSPTAWCPRCETGLSQHEQADEYKDIEDTSVYVMFKLKGGKEDEYLLAWTTTPWTLVANVLLAVNPKYQYVRTDYEGRKLLMLEEVAQKFGFDDYEQVDIGEYIGREYETLFDVPAQQGVEHKVVEWDLVEATAGSGIVHIAPGCGAEDFELGQSLGAASLTPIDSAGIFVDGYGQLVGKYAHDVADEVIEMLKENNSLYKVEEYTHSYPHCWRCKTKVLFRLEDNWFLKVTAIRDKLKDSAASANWIPPHMLKRMFDWLENMGDWMISRKRFYGLSLPFYECEKCGNLHVVGSKEELRELAVNPEKVDELPSLHRPWIDDIRIKCPKCGQEVSRVSDVGDCWLDAGVVPFSTLGYFDNRGYWEKWYPGEFVTEMQEQVRLWFYSMLVFGVILEGSVPYQNVLAFAELRDENNEKISKTKGNGISFKDAIAMGGADVIRWNYARLNITSNAQFGPSVVADVRREFFLPLWNSYAYFVTYANMHYWSPTGLPKGMEAKVKLVREEGTLMDKWLVSALNDLIKRVNEALDKYELAKATRSIESFVKELSTWYIRRSRSRFRDGDKMALATLYMALLGLSKLIAPVVPFIAEQMYLNLAGSTDEGRESVHLEDYPSANEEAIDEDLMKQMAQVRELASLGLAIRDDRRIKLRQPLPRAYTTLASEEFANILADEINVKEIVGVESKEDVPDAEDVILQEQGEIFLALDCQIDDELAKEGVLNELLRNMQVMRKKAGLQVSDQVVFEYDTDDEMLTEVLEANDALIREKVKGTEIRRNDAMQGEEMDVNGHKLRIAIIS